MSDPSLPAEEARTYRCGAAARWLPNVLAASLLVSALLVWARLDAASNVAGSGTFKILLASAATFAALWIRRTGAELRFSFRVEEGALRIVRGARRVDLELSAIDELRFSTPFAGSRRWLPATLLIDTEGRGWRLPTALEGGDHLVAELLRAADRNDLTTWAEVLRIEERMRRGSVHVSCAYGVAAAIVLAGLGFYLH